jgi:hypothetical protein
VATREEKVQLCENLKCDIEEAKQCLKALKRKRRRRQLAGGLLRTGIILVIVAIGIGILALALR